MFARLPPLLFEDYNGTIMTSINNNEALSVPEICAHVKHLGYAASKRVRLYGEEYEVVSDPFPEADGIAVQVTTKKTVVSMRLHLKREVRIFKMSIPAIERGD